MKISRKMFNTICIAVILINYYVSYHHDKKKETGVIMTIRISGKCDDVEKRQ